MDTSVFDNLANGDWPLCVDVLVGAHVTWTPFRYVKHEGKAAVAVHERQRDYTEGGVRLPWGGGDVAQRQAWSRRIRAAREAGLITTAGPNKAMLFKLTPEGLLATSTLVAAHVLGDSTSWDRLARVAELAEKGIVVNPSGTGGRGGFVPEYAVLRYPVGEPGNWPTSAEFVGLELDLLPHLVAEHCCFACDCHGLGAYSLTPAGRAYLKKGKPESRDYGPGLPRLFEEASDYYDREFDKGLKDRENWKQTAKHEIHIPLSAGCWPGYDPVKDELIPFVPKKPEWIKRRG